MDFISEFLDAMRKVGAEPADPGVIVADDKKYRYRIADERKGKKSGRYQLRVDGDFAVGWFLDFRVGKTHRFSSTLGRKSGYTDEQKAEWKAKRDAAMKAQAERITKEHAEAASKAERIWEKAAKKGTTPYLDRKQAALNGARIWRDTIVCVPIKIGGKLTSLQFISQNGDKRFITGSELVGGYFSIAKKDDDLSEIIVCEGFATGDAIRRATGKVVVVAFNAGNLKPVAQAIRKKYPDARITIAADNDRWTTRPTGEAWNPGIDYAQQAAVAIGGARVVWPEFEAGDLGGKPTDFNDALLLYGPDYVRDRITVARSEGSGENYGVEASGSSLSEDDVQTGDLHPTSPEGGEEFEGMPPAPPLEAYYEDMPSLRNLPTTQDWRSLLLVNGEGKLKSSSMRNAMLFIKFHEDFAGCFAYNEFHKNIMIVRCPPWEREEDFDVKRLDDTTITHASAELEKYCINVGTDKAYKALQAVAMEAKFHPAREYFNSLKWDGQKRLERWLTYYLGCESEHSDYLAFVGTKWLVAAVRRVFLPGCKFDHVLVIEGDQGLGKSTALKALATFGVEREESYFTDAVTIADIQQKDTIMKIQGSIIVELSELSGFSKKDDEEIKRWITLQHDDVRLPYGRETSRFERQFVLAATTNRQDYLKDPTGNRRYWPVLAGKRIDMEAIKRDREQLWAEAVHLFREGLYVGPTREEERMATIEREKRLSQDAWTEEVMNYAQELRLERLMMTERGFKTHDVMSKMGLALRDRDDRTQRRIANILQIGGFENRSIWSPTNKRTERFWVRKDGADD